jgi:hypothetical protein
MQFKNLCSWIKSSLSIVFCAVAFQSYSQTQNNLSLIGAASASSQVSGFEAAYAIDGKAGSWKSDPADSLAWLMVKLPGATEIYTVRLKFDQQPISHFKIQTMLNGTWRDAKQVEDNTQKELEVSLEKPILSDRIRFFTREKEVSISELEIYGQQYVDSSATEPKAILLNQSGFNLGRPKRFTAVDMPEGTPFQVIENTGRKEVYQGKISKGIGDFSGFDPETTNEFTVISKGEESYPFLVGPNWMERVTYRNIVDFMAGARHYVGTTDKIRSLSWEWRDGDFFNWALQSMVALYLANPAAFERMEQTLAYIPNSSFTKEYRGLWGALEPFHPSTPDLIQLIHWDVDVKISQGLEHEMQKAELAYFLYAWPYLKKWLPQQNFDMVYQYVKEKWEKNEVEAHSTTQYDLSPGHNLLDLKTKLGSTKGELPPGHSVIPNLMMYEVAMRLGEEDADKYFAAAYQQMAWMIRNLDWHDPMTTKGQRMSEHITMRAFAYFYHQYPDRAPDGLGEKVQEWAKVALSRSDNYWDFRKYSDEEWTPPSWNETGNVLGFPAAALAAMSVMEDQQLVDGLEILAWSHLDNAFGRNPVGRHFSYKGPEEVEGVDLGWYNRHQGGIGLLDEVKFVFDGSPKSFHYPNHPEVGNLGWTEGWVQFNTAFNVSMAYLANYYSSISMEKAGKKLLKITLTAPINFYPEKEETVDVVLNNARGERLVVTLAESHAFSDSLTADLSLTKKGLKFGDQVLFVNSGEPVEASYGYGFFKIKAAFQYP